MAYVKVSVSDGIAEVLLDRPKVNAMNGELIADLGAAFQKVNEDPQIKGALLLSRGKCFSAGLDLKEVARYDRAGIEEFFGTFETGLRPAFVCPKPVAVAVSGHAIAGGLVLAMAADFLAFAEGDYKIGLTELLVGVPFPHEAFEAVRAGLPLRALRRLVYTAELLGPKEAFEIGVGDVLVEDAEAAARFWLTLICSRPLETFAITKRKMRAPFWASLGAPPLGEREDLLGAIFSPQVREALSMALR